MVASFTKVPGGTASLEGTYVWGLDASGTFERAGGVGGLLWINDQEHGKQSVFYGPNHNILGTLPLGSGTGRQPTSRLEYGGDFL